MKLRTRLMITFVAIIVLPLLLTAVAFFGIGTYLMKTDEQLSGLKRVNFSVMSDNMQMLCEITEGDFSFLQEKADLNPESLEDIKFLQQVDLGLANKSSFLIVRKGGEIYFTGNARLTERIFDRLPEYGLENTEKDTGYYYSDQETLVKQIDFVFSDHTQGSAFVVTKINTIITKSLIKSMIVAIILILLFTSLMLTRWIHKGVFIPIRELNSAMQRIAQGNFDYILSTNLKGELGELYTNYEDMRLRLKETADEKIEYDKHNRELISNISHDLKTPITSIKGYVEGIKDGVADTPEKMEKYLKTIYNKANDMDRLINELSIYSKIDSNRIPYNFHRLNISEYFRDCVEEVGLDLESKNIELNYSNLVEPNTKIIADPEQLKRVINNIIGNSIKYIENEHGIIDIRILDEVDSIRVEIEDNGKGIALKDLPNIFDRFYRTDASRNSSKGGSGIGLSIVKKIVEDHGGYIWATSKEGEGTCLHFVIRKYREVESNE